MSTFNGFKPGESRETKLRNRKADGGHSLVKIRTTRQGSSWTFRYTHWCECGKRFSSERSPASLIYRHDAHRRQAGVR